MIPCIHCASVPAGLSTSYAPTPILEGIVFVDWRCACGAWELELGTTSHGDVWTWTFSAVADGREGGFPHLSRLRHMTSVRRSGEEERRHMECWGGDWTAKGVRSGCYWRRVKRIPLGSIRAMVDAAAVREVLES
jgi:hypothetical protein